VPPGSTFSALRLFISADDLIRINERLANAPLSLSEKYSILLAKDCHLSLLLVHEAYALALHSGPQLTRSVFARHYWILHANSLIRSEIKRCIRCANSAGVTVQQQMGHLPKDRVQAAKPFWSSALERFVARRGLCVHLRSDNGTNFKGADRELRSIFREASDFFKESPVKTEKDRMVFYPSFSSSFRRTLGSWYQIYQVSFISRNRRADANI